MIHSTKSISIFNEAIIDYHKADLLQPTMLNPYTEGGLEYLLYQKCWIDSIQWHLEDEVRSYRITAERGWAIKKEIDKYNQNRTDTVEAMDTFIQAELKGTKHTQQAEMNSETPGWILDRLSILTLKIVHMKEEVRREVAGTEHVQNCHKKMEILMEQEEDLSRALDQLMIDLQSGKKYMKVYYQMKMYNDENTNPALYGYL